MVAAVTAAGAGQVGAYDQCHFRTSGTGSFRPLAGADPYIGSVGAVEQVAEDRVELVLPRGRRAAVVAALRAAHPYEEPAFSVLELAPTDTTHGIGRMSKLPTAISAAEFAQRVADALPPTVTGVRLAGAAERLVQRVAVLGRRRGLASRCGSGRGRGRVRHLGSASSSGHRGPAPGTTPRSSSMSPTGPPNGPGYRCSPTSSEPRGRYSTGTYGPATPMPGRSDSTLEAVLDINVGCCHQRRN